MNRKGIFKKEHIFFVCPVGPNDKENQVKMCKKYGTDLGTLPL
jgi:hypothetical protein